MYLADQILPRSSGESVYRVLVSLILGLGAQTLYFLLILCKEPRAQSSVQVW